MYVYFSRAEDETFETMRLVALVGNNSEYDQSKSIAKAHTTRKKFPFQETVYLLMPELWLRRIFPRVIY